MVPSLAPNESESNHVNFYIPAYYKKSLLFSHIMYYELKYQAWQSPHLENSKN